MCYLLPGESSAPPLELVLLLAIGWSAPSTVTGSELTTRNTISMHSLALSDLRRTSVPSSTEGQQWCLVVGSS